MIYRNSLNREPSLPNQLGRTTGSEQTDILLVEALGEVKETGLVIDRDNGCSSQNVTLASEDRKEKVHSGEVSDSMEHHHNVNYTDTWQETKQAHSSRHKKSVDRGKTKKNLDHT